LERLAKAPADLGVHEKLRVAALRHKAAGGRSLGFFQAHEALPKDSLKRLLHIERLWAFEPGSIDYMLRLQQAVNAHAVSSSDLDFDPMRRWLGEIIQRARADGG
jgi:hypothetical protein